MGGVKAITKIQFFMTIRTPFLQIFLLEGVPRYFLSSVTTHCLFGGKRRTNNALHEALRKFIANQNEYFYKRNSQCFS